jgi:hypothetical protein
MDDKCSESWMINAGRTAQKHGFFLWAVMVRLVPLENEPRQLFIQNHSISLQFIDLWF